MPCAPCLILHTADAIIGNVINWSLYGFRILCQRRNKSVSNTATTRPLSNKLQDLQYIDVSNRKYNTVKRILDIIISVAALLVLIIPMLILLMCVYIDDPGKAIFAQNRVGKDGKLFKIYKIRTMLVSAPGNLSAAEFRDADRFVTRMGTLLRKFSLDELPQLFNVLKGDMSIIGPRPLIAEENRIHELRMQYGVYQTRPGITGLAQINGRNNVSTSGKVRWEVRYLENYGFKQDFGILFCTIPKILLGTDVKVKEFEDKPKA